MTQINECVRTCFFPFLTELLSVTTLEEVFIKVGQNDILDEATKRKTLSFLRSASAHDYHKVEQVIVT
jgi:hypothetical protein